MAFADSVKYHRHMVFRESPMENYRGRHEIEAALAQQKLHHQFRYDDQGRLIEVSRRIGDVVTENGGSFEGFFWWAPIVRITYGEGTETRSFHDVSGQRIAAHGNVWRMAFTLDAQGRRTALKYYDQAGAEVDGAWGIHAYEWTYPEPGVVIESRRNVKGESVTLRPNFLFHRVRMEFGHDDLLDFMRNIDEQGNLATSPTGASIDRITYDPWNNFVRWQVYDADERPRNGNAPLVAMGEHIYDGEGYARYLRGFGEKGEDRALNGLRGPLNLAYDRFGNIAAQRELDAKGELLDESRLEYSEDGTRLLWIRHFDAAGQPMERDGVAAIRMNYDDAGRRTAPTRFDLNMQPMTEAPRPARGW